MSGAAKALAPAVASGVQNGGEAAAPVSPPFTSQRDLSLGESAQRQQFLDSYVRVTGHEPTSAEIADFERRRFILSHPDGT